MENQPSLIFHLEHPKVKMKSQLDNEISLEARLIDDQVCEISARALGLMQEILRTAEQRRYISELTKIPAMTLKDYFNGRTSPPLDRFIAIAIAGQVPHANFFGPQGPPTLELASSIDVVHIPHLDVSAAAGDGKFVDVIQAESSVPFPYVFLEKLLGDDAAKARLETLRARGTSMKPTIDDGALLMLDRSQSILPSVAPKHRKIPLDVYVFLQKGEVRLKRLQRVDSDFVAIHSDNIEAFPPEVFNMKRDGSLKIIGKVIWWDNRL